MTAFTMIILVAFIMALVGQFMASIEKECYSLMFVFMFEIVAFAYLAKVLM